MESHYDQILDSPSKNSYIGSYYQPPDRILMPRPPELPAHSSISLDSQIISPRVSLTKNNIDSRAVVDALKTLQQKMRQLELERKQEEKKYRQFFRDAQNHQQVKASCMVPGQPAASQPETDNSSRQELDSKLQSTEARCKVLEKQLDYMRKMVENAKKEERNLLMANQVSLQNQQSSSSIPQQSQLLKLEKLESECLKLGRTQAMAEEKLAILEQKLLKEEHERLLVQEKADQLQKELDTNLRLSVSTSSADMKANKKTKKATKKSSKQHELVLPSGPRHKKMPFVAGTSTSPSHSVHANVQSILHMMKHHQPHLCECVSALQRSGCGIKRNLQKDFALSSTTCHKPEGELEPAAQSLGSLSDLLLGLQDELGQMSFEHQELVGQIETTQHYQQRQHMQRDLERLVARMEEKGAQITKLRNHQQTVHKLTQNQPCPEGPTAKKLTGIRHTVSSLGKAKQKGSKGGTSQNNLQLLRETQKFRNTLKQDDLSWET